jgi:hypothetical protein
MVVFFQASMVTLPIQYINGQVIVIMDPQTQLQTNGKALIFLLLTFLVKVIVAQWLRGRTP